MESKPINEGHYANQNNLAKDKNSFFCTKEIFKT